MSAFALVYKDSTNFQDARRMVAAGVVALRMAFPLRLRNDDGFGLVRFESRPQATMARACLQTAPPLTE